MSLVKHESKVSKPSPAGKGTKGRGGKRKRGSTATQATKRRKTAIISDEETEDAPQEQVKTAPEGQQEEAFEQPALVTGGKLKLYQLEGVAWMVSLWNNGISGILGEHDFLMIYK